MNDISDRIEKMIANFDEEAPAITPEEVVDLLEDCRNCIEDQEARLAELRERVDLATALLEAAPEINPSNYDHDQVCALNDAANQVHRLLNENSKGGEA